jgi:hypothetical protein
VRGLALTFALLVAAPALAGNGQLVINTNPIGATVAVDGVNLGPSPVTARDLLPGDHVVQVWFADGKYLSRIEKVSADSSSVAQFDAAPAGPARGNLAVTTLPPGANVAVDGQVIGVAPATAKDLAPGEHLVQVTWADGQSAQQTVTLDGDAKVELKAAVMPAPAPTPVATPPIAIAPIATQAPRKPVWKKWWFWTAIGGVAVVAIGVGLGVGLSTSPARYGTLEF